MIYPKFNPCDSPENLRKRVAGLLSVQVGSNCASVQIELPLVTSIKVEAPDKLPSSSAGEFLDFLVDATPDGDIYLFGGLLRDLALFGRKGFNSDIDIVVDGDWSNLIPYLTHLGARRNKFGGYRLDVGDWPIDIWNARETWAIRQGLVPYSGIASLTKTTVLNWDAILMNWRTKSFIYKQKYFEEIASRFLDVVLMENPNQKGMAVRVFRHLCHKDARRVSVRAIQYLSECTEKYSFSELHAAEVASYNSPIIDSNIYKLFQYTRSSKEIDIEQSYNSAGHILARELNISGLKI
jgi:hypothetical protein